MESFCGGEFWDPGLTWNNNTWPQFTSCFQNTLLQWLPCTWLWITAPLYLVYCMKNKRKGNPLCLLHCTKLCLCLLLIMLNGLDVVLVVDRSLPQRLLSDELFAPSIWILTLILHIILVEYERQRNVVKSPLLFIFWILGSLALFVPFYSAIMLEIYITDVNFFTLVTMKYGAASILFLLNCFAEFHGQKGKGHNPERSASVMAWISFSWMDKLMLKGFRATLQDDDVFDLHPQDQVANVTPKMIRHWEKQKKKLLRKRQRHLIIVDVDASPDEESQLLLQASPSSHRRKHLTYNSFQDENAGRKGRGDHSLTSDTGLDVEQFASNAERGNEVSFFKTMLCAFWRDIIFCTSFIIPQALLQIFQPFLLGYLINYTKDPDERFWHGYIYALMFVLATVFSTVFSSTSTFLSKCLAIRVRSTTIAMVFTKVLTLSCEARKASTMGEIINLMAVDSGKLQNMIGWLRWIVHSVVCIVAGFYFIATILGVAAVGGFGCLCIMLAVSIFCYNKLKDYQRELMLIKDERMKAMGEILNGIKVIKLYAWEPLFIQKVSAIRKRELRVLLKLAIIDGYEAFTYHIAKFWVLYLFLVAVVYTEDSHYLDANTTYVTMSFINVIQIAMNVLPYVLKESFTAVASFSRLKRFMNSEDINPDKLRRDVSDRLAVNIVDADFAWEKKQPAILRSVNLEVRPGQLIAVVGPVGSGKSSLLSAVLGEMHKVKGSFNLNSSVGYVPQQAWIQNTTLRNNVLFGKSLDQTFYQKVIKGCALEPDLDILPAYDLTEIGEKGINLSGGQKQRVSLARAVYSQADIYLLDDPLSAVDNHVGQHIFDHIIGRAGMLCGKTRVLVTHSLRWLPEVDAIVLMDSGKVLGTATYEQWVKQDGAFAQFLAQYLQSDGQDEDNALSVREIEKGALMAQGIPDSPTSKRATGQLKLDTSLDNRLMRDKPGKIVHQVTDEGRLEGESQQITEIGKCQQNMEEVKNQWMAEESKKQQIAEESKNQQIAEEDKSQVTTGKDKGRLTTEEDMAVGKVSRSVYLAVGKVYGLQFVGLTLALYVLTQVGIEGASLWLAAWNDDPKLGNFSLLPANSTRRADQNNYYLQVYTGLGVAQTLSYLACMLILQNRHLITSRILHSRLLESVMRAPISFFDTVPMGRILNRFGLDVDQLDTQVFGSLRIATDVLFRTLGQIVIICYKVPIFLSVIIPLVLLFGFVQHVYLKTALQLGRLLSKNRSPLYAHFSETLSGVSVIRAYQAQNRFSEESERKTDFFQKAKSASNAAVEWLQIRARVLSAILIGSATMFVVSYRDQLSPSMAGLTVTYAMSMTLEITAIFRELANLEAQLVSVERVLEYSKVTSEAPWISANSSVHTEGRWPTHGAICFSNYSTRYRDGLPLILKDITCAINPGEKVGIVGRTGAGKSSMVLSLFRLVEAASGRIVIDGVDIAQLGLHTLRQGLTLLPQDPVLLAGSLRMNIDPFQEKSDTDLWAAVEHSHLKEFVEGLPQGLDHEVGEGGENLSMGQRQLVCLARALLRKTRILILDEATAAVDMETDEIIQKTIRTEFSGCTILTIAHRLNTVMDYDRILVLHNGEVVEFSAPDRLLSDPSSFFYSMASNAGLVGTTSKVDPH